MLNPLRSIHSKLDLIIQLLRTSIQKEIMMSQATDNLAAAVQHETSVVSSVTTLISGLASQIKQTSTDPQVQALPIRSTPIPTLLPMPSPRIHRRFRTDKRATDRRRAAQRAEPKRTHTRRPGPLF